MDAVNIPQTQWSLFTAEGHKYNMTQLPAFPGADDHINIQVVALIELTMQYIHYFI